MAGDRKIGKSGKATMGKVRSLIGRDMTKRVALDREKKLRNVTR